MTSSTPATSNLAAYPHAQAVLDATVEALQLSPARWQTALADILPVIQQMSGKVVVAGVGKSGIVAHKIAATLASTGTPAVFLHAGEALHGDLGIVGAGDVVILVSKSGATPELTQMLPSLQRLKVTLVGFLGRTDTALARACTHVFDLAVAREGCPLELAPMASSTLALVAGDALAAELLARRGFQAEDFALYHPGGMLGRRLLLTAADVMRTDNLPFVDPATSLRDAIFRMTQSSLGVALVVDTEQQLLGIVTDGDVRRLLLAGTDFTVPVAEHMHQEPITVSPTMPLGEVLTAMENKRRVYMVPVVEAKRCQGLVHMHDIVG